MSSSSATESKGFESRTRERRERRPEGRRSQSFYVATWQIVVLAVVARMLCWLVTEERQFATDEIGYWRAVDAFLSSGQRDRFWPPTTVWVAAICRSLVPGGGIKYTRIFWVLMDIGNLVLLLRLADYLAYDLMGSVDKKVRQMLPVVAGGVWALYLPGMGHAATITSETPTLLLLLIAANIMLSGVRIGTRHLVAVGICLGLTVLTRQSLMPVLVTIPIWLALQRYRERNKRLPSWETRKPWQQQPLILFAIASSIPLAYTAYNARVDGNWVIATNTYYNFYRGNQPDYQEDLNLFWPVATEAQREVRGFQRRAEDPLAIENDEWDDLTRAAWQYIFENPVTSARRVLGRLARIMAPKTDGLVMVGGELVQSVFGVRPMLILIVSALQWAFMLFVGVAGVVFLRTRAKEFFEYFVAMAAGVIPLTLVAISKPRYSYPLDGLLLLAAVVMAMDWKVHWAKVTEVEKRWIFGMWAFFVWSWVAWLIFAFTSRW